MRSLTALLVCSLPVLLHAQVPVSRNGPKVGIGMATITSGGFLSWSGLPKFGPIAGWSFEVPVTNQVSALIEPMYIGKGSVTQNAALKTRSSVSLSYLELPLLLKLSTNPDPQGVFLSAGIIYGYFLRGRVKTWQDGKLLTDYPYSTTTNNSQWSAALGLGSEKGNWMWEVRGQNSFRLFSPFLTSRNVVFSAQVAWRFPKEKKKKKEDGTEEDK